MRVIKTAYNSKLFTEQKHIRREETLLEVDKDY